MKTKTSNKLNILLIAITLLLLFVVCIGAIGSTGSWLVDDDQIGFEISVQDINIEIKQGDRIVSNGGYVYLGTDLIESDVNYLALTTTTTIDPDTQQETETTDDKRVTIKNNETGVGYFIRFKAILKAEGVEYNINQFITQTDFYDHTDDSQDWLYSVKVTENDDQTKTYTNTAMGAGAQLTMIGCLTFTQEFLDTIQGQIITLHLIIEGSATGSF